MDQAELLKLIEIVATLSGALYVFAQAWKVYTQAQSEILRSKASLLLAEAATNKVSAEERQHILDDLAEVKAKAVTAENLLKTANDQLSRLLHTKNLADPAITTAQANAINEADQKVDRAAANT